MTTATCIYITEDVEYWDEDQEAQVWYVDPCDDDGDPVGPGTDHYTCYSLDAAEDQAAKMAKSGPYKGLEIIRD